MCSQASADVSDSHCGWDSDGPGRGGHKTWSQRRAERQAQRASPSPSQSPIRVSSDSGSEYSDTLPDLVDFLPDLVPSPAASVTWPGFHSQRFSSPRKPSTMGSPRRKQERHFLDSFSLAPKYRKMEEDTESLKEFDTQSQMKYFSTKHRRMEEESTDSAEECDMRSQKKSFIPLHPKTEEDSDSLEEFDISPHWKQACEPAPSSSSKKMDAKAAHMKRRGYRNSQKMKAGSVPVQSEECSVFTYPHASSSKASADRRKPVETDSEPRHFRKKYRARFLQDLTTFPPLERLCKSFVNLQTATLDDLLDDSDPSNFLNCLDLLQDFCSKRKPPSMLIDKVIENGFFNQMEENISVHCQRVLFTVWQLYPDTISLDTRSVLVAGDVLQKRLQNADPSSQTVTSATGSRDGADRRVPTFHQARLYFQLFVKGLQLNLSHCTLADQKSVNKSLAFDCLSSDCSQVLIKKLTHWLEFCLVVRQPDHVAVAEQWMCELQTLLEVSVLVRGDRQEAAKKLAPELKRTYKYLTELCAKKQLLQSFSSPLLCFYVLRLVIEDQCESTIVSSQFPSTIHEVIHNYYFALPPQDHMTTPPPSPSEDENMVAHGHSPIYSVQSCEELAMLIYFISKSFIDCKQRK